MHLGHVVMFHFKVGGADKSRPAVIVEARSTNVNDLFVMATASDGLGQSIVTNVQKSSLMYARDPVLAQSWSLI